MNVETFPVSGVKLIWMRRFEDSRGFFSETYNRDALAEIGVSASFVQDNCSLSKARHTVRGLHFQTAPFVQAKLVQVLQGAVLDVALDLRPGSPTLGRHVAVELSAERWNQLWIPRGFAHAFCTLTEDTLFTYKVDSPYAPKNEGGILWCDPQLGIDWPVGPSEAVVGKKDLELPLYRDVVPLLGSYFPGEAAAPPR